MHSLRLAVDIGGTFTDLVLELPDRTVSGKVLTTLGAPEKGVLDGISRLLTSTGVAPGDISMVLHGTTLATNAIIERRGARTALLTTEGFRDTLEFAHGHRFDQYDLELVRPDPLIERSLRFEVPERMAADGSILKELDLEAVGQIAERIKSLNIESLAICFIHSYANGANEARAAEILKQACPDLFLSLSHQVCPEIREYERTSTTVANAYVQPLMVGYLTGLRESLSATGLECPLLLIMSTGSLTSIETAIRFPIRLVESGPAGGAILGQHIAAELDARQSIAFDMGGTTAKIVMLNDFEARRSRSMEVARAHRFMPGSGFPLRMPVIDMIEIGAGGGSIASLDQLRRITVGPESAGSDPGPVCYGQGGTQPTVTDADVVLGRIDPDNFAGGSMRLDGAGAAAALQAAVGESLDLEPAHAALGVSEMVDENMANAARVHAIESGKTIGARTLIAFGGAAPVHAARVAAKLDIGHIVVPPSAGVGSAVGFLRAPVSYEVTRSFYQRLGSLDIAAVDALIAAMRGEAHRVVELGAQGREVGETATALMRYVGQGHEVTVSIPLAETGLDVAAGDDLRERFEAAYRVLYDRIIDDLEIEVLTWVLLVATVAPPVSVPANGAASFVPEPSGSRDLMDGDSGAFETVATFDRADLTAGATIDGPAVIVEKDTATVVGRGFRARLDGLGYIILETAGMTA